MMRFLAILALLTPSCGLRVHECTTGAEGIDVAVAHAAEYWPDVRYQTDNLQVSCKPQRILETSISSCARALADRPESCAVHRRQSIGGHARIDVSHDEDAAISVCHELQHLRDAVWDTKTGCATHAPDCHYDAAAVARCEQAVRTYRGGD